MTIFACLTHDKSHSYISEKHPYKNEVEVNISRAAFLKSSIWPQNSKIKIHFMKTEFSIDNEKYDPNYTPEKAKWVEKTIKKYIVPLVNLEFIWDVSQEESNIRISFVKELGAFSYVGKEAEEEDKKNITMNLGWLDNDTDYDSIQFKNTGAVVVHEFGHLIGMIHEHQRSDIPFSWDKEVVYKQLGPGTANGWSKKEVDQQIFQTTAMSSLNSSNFDQNSIMEYIFPNNYFKSNPNLTPVKYISNSDIVWINSTYPGKPLPDGMTKDGKGPNPFGGSTVLGIDTTRTRNFSWIKNNWYWLLIYAIIISIIVYSIIYLTK
jgi:serralysin